jgi:hypothetical protein
MSDLTDLTAVFYTAGHISSAFMENTHKQLLEALGDIPLITITKPSNVERSHFQIYRQALEGAKQAQTRFIALVEDDELYSPEHFKYRPKNKPFAYNLGYWGIYTWREPMFHYKGRRNLGNLICEREAFIEAMEERFAKYPNPDPNDQHLKDIWGEPSKYERQLGITPREYEEFYTLPPNIKFSHQTELSFAGLGTRKRAGDLQALELPYWGRAEDVAKLY